VERIRTEVENYEEYIEVGEYGSLPDSSRRRSDR
jgi:hypothetical protein